MPTRHTLLAHGIDSPGRRLPAAAHVQGGFTQTINDVPAPVTLSRQDRLGLVAPVAEVDTLTHELATGLRIHYLTDHLQAVATGVEMDVRSCLDTHPDGRKYTLSDAA
jgi:hypothetical protein